MEFFHAAFNLINLTLRKTVKLKTTTVLCICIRVLYLITVYIYNNDEFFYVALYLYFTVMVDL